MASKIFVNLPVKDLQKSIAFFTTVGYTFSKQFTDETASCMIVTEDIMFMLVTEEKFKSFAPKGICDTSVANEVGIGLSLDNREAVDEIVAKALAAGGSTYEEPKDYGFMYSHGFQDLDGHVWDYFYMDPSHIQES
ncbi:glyoxalase/bleomycin resistance/extradiol dioxygenase family protein [bacterium]|nr:MAG: glyoxalase/bleomycin resistance/extradiol dioxygenase family protein [bacterium]